MTTHARAKWADWVYAKDFLAFIEPYLHQDHTRKWYLNGKHLPSEGDSKKDYELIDAVKRGKKRRLLMTTAERICVRYDLDPHRLDELLIQD